MFYAVTEGSQSILGAGSGMANVSFGIRGIPAGFLGRGDWPQAKLGKIRQGVKPSEEDRLA